jgi:3-oxoadipate enol-lactonase
MGSGTLKTSDGCMIGFRVHPAPGPRAPRMVLVHSLALDRSIWDGVVTAMKGQAEILTYDCRGHGRSERRAGPYTAELFARDLAELLDHVGWPAASIAGCSMGGCVAQAFAAAHPTRVVGLGLIDTTAWYGPKAPEQWHERAEAARQKGFQSLLDFQLTRWFGDAFRKLDTEAAKSLADLFLKNDVECYAATCEMLGQADLRSSLASITAPTVVIVGEEDAATPVDMSRALHKAIKGSTLSIVPSARHLTPVEKPKEVAALLAQLLPHQR